MRFLTKVDLSKLSPSIFLTVYEKDISNNVYWNNLVYNRKIIDYSFYINLHEIEQGIKVNNKDTTLDKFLISQIKSCILHKKHFIFINGNFITKDSRKKIIEIGNETNYEVVCVHFTEKNELPTRDDLLIRKIIKENPPSIDEGLTKIITIN